MSMHIFREIVGKIEPLFDKNYITSKEFSDYFNVEPELESEKEHFHCFINIGIMRKIYNLIDNDPILYKDFDYNNQKFLN